jgi:hypothetical protein
MEKLYILKTSVSPAFLDECQMCELPGKSENNFRKFMEKASEYCKEAALPILAIRKEGIVVAKEYNGVGTRIRMPYDSEGLCDLIARCKAGNIPEEKNTAISVVVDFTCDNNKTQRAYALLEKKYDVEEIEMEYFPL